MMTEAGRGVDAVRGHIRPLRRSLWGRVRRTEPRMSRQPGKVTSHVVGTVSGWLDTGALRASRCRLTRMTSRQVVELGAAPRIFQSFSEGIHGHRSRRAGVAAARS